MTNEKLKFCILDCHFAFCSLNFELKMIWRQENKVTQHQLGQIKQKLSKLSQKKQKLSKLSQKFELVAAGFILRFIRNLKIAPTIILPSLLVTHYSSLLSLFAKL